MRRASRTAPAAVGLALLLVLAGCAGAGTGGTADVANPGYVSGDGAVTVWEPGERGAAVEVAGTDYTGGPVDLADWRGDVVVVNFWYAACPPCRAEAPDLVALAGEVAADGVRFVGVNSTDDAGAALAFERTFGIGWPTIADPEARAIAAMQGKVALRAVPTTLVLDREGRIAARVLGRAEASTLRALVLDEVAAA